MLTYPNQELLVEPEWLTERLQNEDIRVIDCDDEASFKRSHILNAVVLPVHGWIKNPNDVHVLNKDAFAELMGQLGIDENTLVVPYDNIRGMHAARLWWVLRYYGHNKTKILNGGWKRWTKENRPVTTEFFTPKPKHFKVNIQEELLATKDEILHKKKDFQIVDVRTDDEWFGKNSRGNRYTGHLEDAVHMEWTNAITPELDTFKSPEALEQLLVKRGIKKDQSIITYCQAGVRASHTALMFSLLDYQNVKVYDGSMQEWANDASKLPLIQAEKP